jgi:hypothetical protein
LRDGTLLWPVYREYRNPLRNWSAVIRSTDKGKTWSEPLWVDETNGDNDEPALCELPDGTILCVMRTNGGDSMWVSRSHDKGLTWTKSTKIGFKGQAPYLFRTPPGVLLLAHRLPGTSLHYSLDDGKTWSDVVMLDVTIGAYPSMVLLKNGEVLIVYYEEGPGSPDALVEEGINVEIVDPRSLSPLDEETILASVKKTGRLVVADTAWKRCGFAAEVADRRANPKDDLITALCQTEHEGEPLPDEVVVGMCNLQLVAGIDTTWSSIGSALWHFAGHGDDRRRMADADDGLWDTAIEELLRFYAPVTMARNAGEDVEYGGVTFRKGDKILMNFPGANHDPDHFEYAHEVHLDRQRNRHVAFGIGIHRCAGSNLARMEMQVALKTWFERIPEFTLSDPDAVTWAGGQVRGPRIMPVTFG